MYSYSLDSRYSSLMGGCFGLGIRSQTQSRRARTITTCMPVSRGDELGEDTVFFCFCPIHPDGFSPLRDDAVANRRRHGNDIGLQSRVAITPSHPHNLPSFGQGGRRLFSERCTWSN